MFDGSLVPDFQSDSFFNRLYMQNLDHLRQEGIKTELFLYQFAVASFNDREIEDVVD